MAKRHSRATSSPRPADRILEARVRKTIANVRGHWERGRRADRQRAKHDLQELAQNYGGNPNTLRKDRLFAERYSPMQLKELLPLRRPDRTPLHWGYVVYLITVEDVEERRRLEEQAATKGWSAPDLLDALRKGRDGDAHSG